MLFPMQTTHSVLQHYIAYYAMQALAHFGEVWETGVRIKGSDGVMLTIAIEFTVLSHTD